MLDSISTAKKAGGNIVGAYEIIELGRAILGNKKSVHGPLGIAVLCTFYLTMKRCKA